MGYAGLNPNAERTLLAGTLMDLAKQQTKNTADIATLTANVDELRQLVHDLLAKEEADDAKAGLCRREVDAQIQDIAADMRARKTADKKLSDYKWKAVGVIGTLFGIAGVVAAILEKVG